MEKEKIETKDKEFRDKLKQMRTNLAMRQVQADRKESKPRNHVKVVIPMIVVLAVAVYFVGKTMRTHQPVSASIPNKMQIGGDRHTALPDHDRSESNVISATQASDDTLSGEFTSNNVPNSAAGADIEPQETAEVKSDTLPTSSVTSPSPNRTRITQNIVCSGVRGRNCAIPKSVFALNKNQKPHVWMEVYSDSVPYKLNHVYYHEGRKFVQVPLKIEYRRMRTWSNINLNNSNLVGSWHVETVAEDGTVLGRVEFKVTTGR